MNAPAFTLLRVAIRPDGAFGVLKHHETEYDAIGLPFAATLERTYPTFAEAGISERYQRPGFPDQYVKIPHGRFTCKRSFFNRGGYWTFEVLVPGHSRLLFHKGNVEAHSEGCILVAESFHGAGIENGSGLAELLSRVSTRTEFELEVRAA